MASSTHAGVLLPRMLTLSCIWAAGDTSLLLALQRPAWRTLPQGAQRLPDSKLAGDPGAQLPQCVLLSSQSLLTCFPQQTSLRLEPTWGQFPSPCSAAQPPSGPQPRQLQEYIRRFQ